MKFWIITLIVVLCMIWIKRLPRERVVKIKILESGTITYCKLTSVQGRLLKEGDSIWLDLTTNRINTTLSTSMKCIIIDKN